MNTRENARKTASEGTATKASRKIPTHIRRKYSTELEISFLKEVIVAEAHVCGWGQQATAFGKVASALNETKALPWEVDSKHCVDKFKAILKSFRNSDAAGKRSSGTTEDFGEKETLLYDIVSRMDDEAAQKQELRDSKARQELALRKEGEEIRRTSMSSQGMREVSVANSSKRSIDCINIDEEEVASPRKTKKKNACSTGTDTELLGYLEIERKRTEQEDAKLQLDKERVAIEKDRLLLDTKRFEAANEERRAMLQQIKGSADIQMQMLEMINSLKADKK